MLTPARAANPKRVSPARTMYAAHPGGVWQGVAFAPIAIGSVGVAGSKLAMINGGKVGVSGTAVGKRIPTVGVAVGIAVGVRLSGGVAVIVSEGRSVAAMVRLAVALGWRLGDALTRALPVAVAVAVKVRVMLAVGDCPCVGRVVTVNVAKGRPIAEGAIVWLAVGGGVGLAEGRVAVAVAVAGFVGEAVPLDGAISVGVLVGISVGISRVTAAALTVVPAIPIAGVVVGRAVWLIVSSSPNASANPNVPITIRAIRTSPLRSRRMYRLSREGQRHQEGAALPRFTLQPQPPLMCLCQRFRYG